MNQRSRKRREPQFYTTSELNQLIDSIMHPLAKNNPYIMILDGLLHGIVERNPSASTVKFIKYNLPKLLEQLATPQVKQNPRD